tara:strand:- start:1521 stop:1934 length:414 start_codon:yes stop_codon:yes gene_type:complete
MAGDNKAIHALIAFLISLFIVLNPTVFDIVRSISPWIGLVMVLLMFMLPLMRILIPSMEEATYGARGTFLLIVVFIIIIAVFVRIRQDVTAPGEGEEVEEVDYSKVSNVILNPKMLGGLFLLMVAVLTIAMLTTKNS